MRLKYLHPNIITLHYFEIDLICWAQVWLEQCNTTRTFH